MVHFEEHWSGPADTRQRESCDISGRCPLCFLALVDVGGGKYSRGSYCVLLFVARIRRPRARQSEAATVSCCGLLGWTHLVLGVYRLDFL